MARKFFDFMGAYPKKIPSRDGWRAATAVAQRRGGSVAALHNPPQGLTALAPPRRGFNCHFLSHLTPRSPAVFETPMKILLSC